MQTKQYHPLIARLVWLILSATTIGAFYISYELKQTATQYSAIQRELAKPEYGGSVGTVELDGASKTLNIPSWHVFSKDGNWLLVSKTSPLSITFTPYDLVDTALTHGDSQLSMKVSARIVGPLQAMVAAAEQDGISLVLSSAYRSIDDQTKLRDDFIETRGEALAAQYVAEPGSSEHHTGLAVDLSDFSSKCLSDSDSCSLSPASAEWLDDNAHRFGFIQRYPEGSSSITGISFEPWHYRYVGVVLATQLHDTGMTFDEFIDQLR